MPKALTLMTLAVLLAVALVPSFAAGPVYDELPDLEGREIIIGMENFYPPYQFNDPRADEPIGFEYDMINQICERLNCTPVYEETTFELQLAGVADGTYEMVANGLFITEERQENFDFSMSYTQAETFLMVREDEDRFGSVQEFVEMASDEDLIWGVQNNSFGQVLATDIYSVPEDNIVTFDEFGALLVALRNGDIDTMAVDAFNGTFVGPSADFFRLIGDPLVDPVPMGLMFQQDSDLVAPFDAALQSMMDDGYMDFLFYKWSEDYQVFEE
ncbi:MAG: substrate-binding periplasmic protein [Anaerolineales bacterium]